MVPDRSGTTSPRETIRSVTATLVAVLAASGKSEPAGNHGQGIAAMPHRRARGPLARRIIPLRQLTQKPNGFQFVATAVRGLATRL